MCQNEAPKQASGSVPRVHTPCQLSVGYIYGTKSEVRGEVRGGGGGGGTGGRGYGGGVQGGDFVPTICPSVRLSIAHIVAHFPECISGDFSHFPIFLHSPPSPPPPPVFPIFLHPRGSLANSAAANADVWSVVRSPTWAMVCRSRAWAWRGIAGRRMTGQGSMGPGVPPHGTGAACISLWPSMNSSPRADVGPLVSTKSRRSPSPKRVLGSATSPPTRERGHTGRWMSMDQPWPRPSIALALHTTSPTSADRPTDRQEIGQKSENNWTIWDKRPLFPVPFPPFSHSLAILPSISFAGRSSRLKKWELSGAADIRRFFGQRRWSADRPTNEHDGGDRPCAGAQAPASVRAYVRPLLPSASPPSPPHSRVVPPARRPVHANAFPSEFAHDNCWRAHRHDRGGHCRGGRTWRGSGGAPHLVDLGGGRAAVHDAVHFDVQEVLVVLLKRLHVL